MDKDTLIKNITILLNEKNIKVSESALSLYIDKTIQYILNYCNLTELPQELYYTVIDMVVNACFKAQSSSDNIASIQEGGRTVSFINYKDLDVYKYEDGEFKTVLNKFKRFYKYD